MIDENFKHLVDSAYKIKQSQEHISVEDSQNEKMTLIMPEIFNITNLTFLIVPKTQISEESTSSTVQEVHKTPDLSTEQPLTSKTTLKPVGNNNLFPDYRHEGDLLQICSYIWEAITFSFDTSQFRPKQSFVKSVLKISYYLYENTAIK